MKYEFIDTYRSEFTVIRMCKTLKVFESGFFRWKNRTKTAKQIEDERIIPIIRRIHEESKKTYGPTRLKAALEKEGIDCGISRLRRLMKENGIYSVTRYKHNPYPKQKVETRYNENVLKREFNVKKPNRVWCGDITYVKTISGWVYLAVVIDLFNREVVGYSLSKKPNSELPMRAMATALAARNPGKRLIFHTDRGCQYSSRTFLRYLKDNNIISSMSRTGNPYDNACTESFFATLKKEWIYQKRYRNQEELDGSLFEYIELFYNRKRLHTRLDYLSPKEYYYRYKKSKTA